MNRVILQAFAIGASAAVVLASGMVRIAGQQAPVSSVFTAQQATEGKVAYTKNCASCHMPDLSGNNEIPPLAGKAFMGTWGTRSAKELFDYMSAAMPYGGPSLTTQSYTVITAYILQSNGASAGTEPLSASMVAPIVSLTATPVPPPAVPVASGRAETIDGVAPADGGGDGAVPAP